MAWPSGTKAGTTNVDAGTDRPSNARADIKQNIDNVNSIIDEFNISSPSDGDLLQYSTSTSKWEQVASSSVGASVDIAYIRVSGNQGEQVSGNLYRRPMSVIHNPGFITQPGDTGFGSVTNEPTSEDFAGQATITLAAGTYFFQVQTARSNDTQATMKLHDETNTTELSSSSAFYDEMGTSGEGIWHMNIPYAKCVFTGSTEISLRQTATNSTDRDVTFNFTIHKVA